MKVTQTFQAQTSVQFIRKVDEIKFDVLNGNNEIVTLDLDVGSTLPKDVAVGHKFTFNPDGGLVVEAKAETPAPRAGKRNGCMEQRVQG